MHVMFSDTQRGMSPCFLGTCFTFVCVCGGGGSPDFPGLFPRPGELHFTEPVDAHTYTQQQQQKQHARVSLSPQLHLLLAGCLQASSQLGICALQLLQSCCCSHALLILGCLTGRSLLGGGIYVGWCNSSSSRGVTVLLWLAAQTRSPPPWQLNRR